MIILAAGSGSRYQGYEHKLLAPFRGRPLISWVLEAVSSLEVKEKILVVGSTDLETFTPPEFTVLHNPQWVEGMASSLAVGVDWARRQGHDGVVVGLGDQPGISPVTWELVLAARKRPIAVATYQGIHRNPVRLGREVWGMLPTTGDEGARSLIASRPELVENVACEGMPFDIDTVEDLQKWS